MLNINQMKNRGNIEMLVWDVQVEGEGGNDKKGAGRDAPLQVLQH